MKVAVPIENRDHHDAKPFGHFGSAPFFLVIDTDSRDIEILDNRDHVHGSCSPMTALADLNVTGVIVAGIGGRAIERLINMGITVYQAHNGTISENIEALIQGRLSTFTVERSCGHHRRGGCGGH